MSVCRMLSMQFFLTWKSIAIKSRGFLVKEMVEIHDENEKQDMFDVKNVLASGCSVIKKCWYNTGQIVYSLLHLKRCLLMLNTSTPNSQTLVDDIL